MEITHPTAAAVRAELARRGFTQTDAAGILGLSQTAFSRRLVGHVDFSVTEVRHLAAWLQVSVATLMPEIPADFIPAPRVGAA